MCLIKYKNIEYTINWGEGGGERLKLELWLQMFISMPTTLNDYVISIPSVITVNISIYNKTRLINFNVQRL